MNIPPDLRYSKDHEWVRVEGDVAVVGITDFAQSELGDIVFVEVETEDEDLEVDAVFGTIEAVKTVADLFSPVTGLIKEVNTALNDDPGLVNHSPYGEGWFVKIELADRAELDGLMEKSDYDKMVGKE